MQVKTNYATNHMKMLKYFETPNSVSYNTSENFCLVFNLKEGLKCLIIVIF